MTPKEMAQRILGMEARRDRDGHLTVYRLPGNDGGGSYEVAGINERYDLTAAQLLVWLIANKRFQEAESFATLYIEWNTDGVKEWGGVPAIQYVLRDMTFNRGLTGAAKILQMSLPGVVMDGKVGPKTKEALAKADPLKLLIAMRLAREEYEREVAGYRQNLWAGLVSRWETVTAIAKTELNA